MRIEVNIPLYTTDLHGATYNVLLNSSTWRATYWKLIMCKLAI